MKLPIVLATLAVASIATVLLALAQRRHHEIVLQPNLTYGEVAGTELKLDLAMPKAGNGPFPAVVFLHGEGWKAGNRQQMSHFVEGMAGLGYVAVAVEYRLVPTARFPAQVEDCKASIRWLRANAATYRVDPDRIGVVGFSAGGHLASMLGVAGKKDGLEGAGGNGHLSSRVQAVVTFFGPTDFSTRDWSRDLEAEVIVPFLGGSSADVPDAYKRASPINYVTKDAPPFLLFHGMEDKLVPVDQSIVFAEKLKSVGVPTQLVVFQGEGHGFTDATNQKAMQQMLDFLDQRLQQ